MRLWRIRVLPAEPVNLLSAATTRNYRLRSLLARIALRRPMLRNVWTGEWATAARPEAEKKHSRSRWLRIFPSSPRAVSLTVPTPGRFGNAPTDTHIGPRGRARARGHLVHLGAANL